MSTFFGLTALGDGTCFESSTQETDRLKEIPAETFLEAFDSFCLGDSMLARDMQVDGTSVMMRAKLYQLAEQVVSGPLNRQEQDLFRLCFDTQTSGLISKEEFVDSVARLLDRVEHPGNAAQYASGNALREDMHKHRLNHLSPQQYFTTPVTANQEIGWRVHTASQADRKYFPLRSTTITAGPKEGRSIQDYVGAF